MASMKRRWLCRGQRWRRQWEWPIEGITEGQGRSTVGEGLQQVSLLIFPFSDRSVTNKCLFRGKCFIQMQNQTSLFSNPNARLKHSDSEPLRGYQTALKLINWTRFLSSNSLEINKLDPISFINALYVRGLTNYFIAV